MVVNAELLRRVATYIEEHPERYNQQVWFEDYRDDVERDDDDPEEDEMHFPTLKTQEHLCKTRACVAGIAVLLEKKFPDDSPSTYMSTWYPDTARELFGLDEEMGDWLFSHKRDEEAMPTLLRAIAEGADLDHLMELEGIE